MISQLLDEAEKSKAFNTIHEKIFNFCCNDDDGISNAGS